MKYSIAILAATTLVLSANINAAQVQFDFTGRLVVTDSIGTFIGPVYTPISASLTYDTVTGVGSSDLSITMEDFLGIPATFYDITMSRIEGTNLIDGQLLIDWNNADIAMHVQWDATGLFNAINYGLQEWDVLSGSTLYHDANHNGVQDEGEFIRDIGSAIPYSDSLQYSSVNEQGAAPMAATSASLGLTGDVPFPGIRAYLDIGSGNSMHVTGVSAVPIPAAVWLFGSGLIGLAGLARRKKA